jgi:hypothetical protein
LRRYYVLFFIEHDSRRVWLAGCTTNPDGGWVTQQARILGLCFAEQQIRFLIRDRDSKYTSPFDGLPQRTDPHRADSSAGIEGERDRRTLRQEQRLRAARKFGGHGEL